MPVLTFPETRQSQSFDCGASATQSVLYYYGIERREDLLIKELGSTPERGTPPGHIAKYILENGLSLYAGKMSIASLKRWIDKGVPVIMPIQAWPEDPNKDYALALDEGHYVCAIGYEDAQIIFDDPSLLGNRGYIPEVELDKRWHDVAENKWLLDHFGIAVFGRKPSFNPQKMIKIESQGQRIASRWLRKHA